MCSDCKAADQVMRQHVRLPIPGERRIARENEIRSFVHCRQCLAELPRGQSPSSYARLNVGMTEQGLQVWCVRHDKNVLHVDFEEHTHPMVS